MPRKHKEDVMVEPGQGLNLDPELIKQLVPGMLDRSTLEVQLRALKKAIFERALGAEMTHHLGYSKGEAKPAELANYRNGSSRKRVTTDDDTVELEIPRDREGTFDPVLIAKGERRFKGFDDKIIAMYARGRRCARFRVFCWRCTASRCRQISSARSPMRWSRKCGSGSNARSMPCIRWSFSMRCASRSATKVLCATRRSTWPWACAAMAHAMF